MKNAVNAVRNTIASMKAAFYKKNALMHAGKNVKKKLKFFLKTRPVLRPILWKTDFTFPGS